MVYDVQEQSVLYMKVNFTKKSYSDFLNDVIIGDAKYEKVDYNFDFRTVPKWDGKNHPDYDKAQEKLESMWEEYQKDDRDDEEEEEEGDIDNKKMSLKEIEEAEEMEYQEEKRKKNEEK